MFGWGSWENLAGVGGLLIRTHYMKTMFSIIIIIIIFICNVYAFVMADLVLSNKDRLTDILLQISLFMFPSIQLLRIESLLTFLTV